MQDRLVKVLNHGHVMLLDHMGSDLSVARAARVSYDAHWRAGQDQGSDAKLINYLWKNAHSTPFEAVTFTFDIKAPIFVLRQWHRHRTWAYNELSARYRELPEEYYLPGIEDIGEQSTVSKQARVVTELDPLAKSIKENQIKILENQIKECFKTYKQLLELGWPRELARSILPVATYSHMQATVNLRNLFAFLTLRTHPHAQYETRVYAEALLKLIRPIVPVCVDAWESTLSK